MTTLTKPPAAVAVSATMNPNRIAIFFICLNLSIRTFIWFVRFDTKG